MLGNMVFALDKGQSFGEQGVNASDDVDGDLSANVSSGGTIYSHEKTDWGHS